MTDTPEQRADLLERLAQRISADDLGEIADNLLILVRAISLLKEWFDQDERSVVDPYVEDRCFFCNGTMFSTLAGMDEGHEDDCYYLKVRQFLASLK